MASDDALQFLLNHFIKGRLYTRDLKHDEVFMSIGNSGLKIERLPTGEMRLSHNIKKSVLKMSFLPRFTDNITVNHANIIESEVFVYNLGTMYYIDDVLYPEILEKIVQSYDLPSSTAINYKFTTVPDADVEAVPSEITESSEEKQKDILLQNDEGFRNDKGSNSGFGIDDDDDEEEDEDDDEIVTPRALPVQYMINSPKK